MTITSEVKPKTGRKTKKRPNEYERQQQTKQKSAIRHHDGPDSRNVDKQQRFSTFKLQTSIFEIVVLFICLLHPGKRKLLV